MKITFRGIFIVPLWRLNGLNVENKKYIILVVLWTDFDPVGSCQESRNDTL
jgi:hypothetical protein